MSKNPLMSKMRTSLQKDTHASQPESVSAQEAPLAIRNRFRLAEELGGPAAGAVQSGVPAIAPAPLVLPEDTEWSPDYRRWCIANNYQPRATIELNLSQVKESAFNPRHFYLARRLEDLIASIAEAGQQQPIHVVPDYAKPGEFFIHDGGRRIRAMRALKHAKVRALVVDVPIGIQSYKLGYELNTRRENQSPFDNAVKWTYLLEHNHFASQKELAETLGQDESIVSQTLTIGKLPEEALLEMISNQERFPVRVAYEVSKFYQDNNGDLEKTLELVERIVRLDMRQRQVIEYRSRYNAERRGGGGAPRRAARSRAESLPIEASHTAQSGQSMSPAGAARREEQFASVDGRLVAILSEGEGSIMLNVRGDAQNRLAPVLESLRELLKNTLG